MDGLFHCKIGNYELFMSSCNVLEIEEQNEFPPEYTYYKEGEAKVKDSLAHQFPKDEPIKYQEAKLQEINLGDQRNPKTIFIGNDWDPVLKVATFQIFMKYKDVFAWTYKDLKGVPLELYVH